MQKPSRLFGPDSRRPLQLKLLSLSHTNSKIEVDQALVRDSVVFRHAFEIFNNAKTQRKDFLSNNGYLFVGIGLSKRGCAGSNQSFAVLPADCRSSVFVSHNRTALPDQIAFDQHILTFQDSSLD
jgi:hypothetical protein